jgi:hypothetical protein
MSQEEAKPSNEGPPKLPWNGSLARVVALVGSPIALALLGLLGTSITTVWQGHENLVLEKRKFEFSLIQEALKTEYLDEAVKKLQFLSEAHMITALDEDNIQQLINKHRLPIFAGAAIKYHLVSPREAKQLMRTIGVFDGNDEDVIDEDLFKAVANFQIKYNNHGFSVQPGDKKEDKLNVDGLLGPQTYFLMRQVQAATTQ